MGGRSVNIPAKLDANIQAIHEVARQIEGISDGDTLKELRARVEAAKAWAKAHKKIKEVRRDLLSVEVNILRRIVAIGQVEILAPNERPAAEFFHGLSADDVEDYLTEHDGVTTATGLYNTIKRIERLEQQVAFMRNRGRENALDARPPSDDADIEDARDELVSVSAALSSVLENMDSADEFTIGEMADGILDGLSTPVSSDDTFRRGFEEVCREAVRRAPALRLGATKLPRFVTARVENGKYMRIPIQAAKLWHLKDMCELRREQLKQDADALARLTELYDQLLDVDSACDESSISELVRNSMVAS